MGLYQVFCMCLLATVGQTQGLQNCSVETNLSTVGSPEDAANLATSLECSDGDFIVEWVGEVFVEQTLRVSNGTSLNITGAGPGAIADGQQRVQLFVVDGGVLHLTGITLAHGYASSEGGAIYAESSTVLISGNTSFISNSAGGDGGAIHSSRSKVTWDGDGVEFSNNYAGNGGAISLNVSTMSWDGDATEFSNNSASNYGGAIYSDNSNVSWNGDGTEFSNNSASNYGGAIYSDNSNVSWNGDGTEFRSNSAVLDGGAIHSHKTNVSWNGDSTEFSNNSAASSGGAIYLSSSKLSWDGHATEFRNNSAGDDGGAIYSFETNVSWDGDGTKFISNFAAFSGGAIGSYGSIVTWDGDGSEFSDNFASSDGGAIHSISGMVAWDCSGTEFRNNSAGDDGGVMYLYSSNVVWNGAGTEFSHNYAGDEGGAIWAHDSEVSWGGDGTEFSKNSAGIDGGAVWSSDSNVTWDGGGTEFCTNHADAGYGGAIFAEGLSGVSWNGPTNFSGNVAGHGGGAVALVDFGYEQADFTDATFIDNDSKNGGALYVYNSGEGFNFTHLRFVSNSASDAGGAFAMYSATDHQLATFSGCDFVGNTANGTGGAVETLSGQQEFISCDFEGNSADVGGAMRLGSETVVRECSFVSNFAHTRGLAIAVVGSANISGSSFSGNELYCSVGLFREDTEEEESTERFQAVCYDCPTWDECSDCSIARGHVTPSCVPPLEHTSAEGTGVTLETLDLAGGYWRATNKSYGIQACFNADACRGGQTGAESYCNSGYKGPYCAVCETGFSPSSDHLCTRCSSSKRQGLIAAATVAALVAVFATVVAFKFLLSTEFEERGNGWFYGRALRALPVQAVKIVVVVWQILTQFADAANVTYPGVYQDFLSVIDIVNFDLASALAAGCLWSDMDFHDRLLVNTLGPLAVVGVLAITYRIAMHRSGAAGRTALADRIRHRHQVALLSLTFLVYSSVSSTVFQTFACETLDDGIEYLRADYSIYCSDAKHQAIEVYAGIMVLVYPVGIPLLYTVMLYQHRFLLSDAGADKAAAQPISSLWEPYRPERFYYEVVECARRIMLTGVVVFIFPDDAAQIAITMLIAFFFFVVFEALLPYESGSDIWLSRGGHVIVFLSMFDMLLLKIDVSDESDRSQAIFAGVLVAGHALIALAIVVEIAGVYYAFRKKHVVDEAPPVQSLVELRQRAGLEDDVPVFESVPATWMSFMRRVSVEEEPGPSHSASGSMMTVDGS